MPRPLIETFQTERLVAESLCADHLTDYVQLFGNSRVMATLSADGNPLPVEEAARWLQFSLEHWDRHGYGYWLVRTKSDKQFVGRAGLKCIHTNDRDEVELGYAVLPEFWNQGLATEIARHVVKLAFDQLGLRELISCTLTTNIASRRVMEKTGFRFEREGTNAGLPHVYFRLTAAEFSATGK